MVLEKADEIGETAKRRVPSILKFHSATAENFNCQI
jgi:hypothetical protein